MSGTLQGHTFVQHLLPLLLLLELRSPIWLLLVSRPLMLCLLLMLRAGMYHQRWYSLRAGADSGKQKRCLVRRVLIII